MLACAVYEASKKRIKTETVVWMFVFSTVSGIITGKLAVFFLWDNPASLFDISRFYTASSGVVAGSLAGAYAYCRIRKLPIWKHLDLFALGGGLIVFFGRLGCYFRGCCIGKPSVFWQKFGIATHPFQLYDAANGLMAFFVVLWVKKAKHPEGALILAYLISYSAVRFVIEFFRAEQTFLYLTYSQYFYLLVLCAAAWKSKTIYTRLPEKVSKHLTR